MELWKKTLLETDKRNKAIQMIMELVKKQVKVTLLFGTVLCRASKVSRRQKKRKQ